MVKRIQSFEFLNFLKSKTMYIVEAWKKLDGNDGINQTWKMDLPLGSPEILLTPLWSTILVARSKFLPNMKCKLRV